LRQNVNNRELAWSRGAIQLLSFVTTVLVARILVPADFGVMAIASVFIAASGVLAEMGLGTAIVQFPDLDRRDLDTCFWIIMTLAFMSYAVLAHGAPSIARWFAIPRLADVLPILALGLPVNACSVVSGSLLRKRLSLDRVLQAEIFGTVVTLPVMLGCALAGFGVWSLVVGFLAGSVVKSITIFAFAPWRPGLRIDGGRAKEMLQSSLRTLGITVPRALQEQADVAVIGKFTGQVTVGLYSMAKDLAMLPGAKISSAVYALSPPINVAVMRRLFFQEARLTAAIALPASVGFALVADDFVAVLLGPKWLPSVTVFRLLCLYAVVRAFDTLLPPVLIARGRQRFLVWYYLALLLGVLTAATLGTLLGGAPGAVVLFTPVYFGLTGIMTKEVLAELDQRFSKLWFQIWPIVTATAAMAAVVFLLQESIFARRTASPLDELILLSVSGAVTYFGALSVFGKRPP
jgi:O-antigen/teichoic acid export membrane protein